MHGETSRGRSGGSPVSRRAVLKTMPYAAGLALVSGCGLRLDLPAPPATTPTRRRVPDEDLLIHVVRDLRDIAALESEVIAAGHGGAILPTLRKLHQEQVRIIVGRLTNAGVPLTEIDGQTPTSDHSPTSVPSRPPSRKEIATRLAERSPAFWTDVATATGQTREVLIPATIARLAGAVLLRQRLAFEKTGSAARSTLVEQTAQLVYGFEVVAAQLGPDRRKRALTTLAALRVLSRDLGGRPSGNAWSLPFPVATPRDAARLATHLLTAAINSASSFPGGAPTPSSLEDAATWGGRVQALGPAWSVPLTPFPGMA